MRLSTPLLILALLASLAPSASPAALAAESGASPRPLFERIGGRKGTRCLAGNLIDRLEGNARLMSNEGFREVAHRESKLKVKTRLADWICKLTGGPCRPRQGLLDHVPKGVQVSAIEWLTVVQEANRALDACQIPTREKGEMITLLVRNRNS